MTPALQVHARDIPHTQRERLAYLELRAFFVGELHRSDIETRFGVKPAAATRDLAAYRQLAPSNLEYDTQARCYRPTPQFSPVFALQAERVLAWLRQGFGDGLDTAARAGAPCEGPGEMTRPNLALLAQLTRAIVSKQALRVVYQSLQTGPSERVLVPVALADNGQRWHLRAFDRRSQQFRDFVITRITSVEGIAGEVPPDQLLEADTAWAQVLQLSLVPHPGIKWPQAIAADYAMVDGKLHLAVRAALAGYTLRRWSVDCSPTHTLDPTTHHLWLSNPAVLNGVPSAALAPGYIGDAAQ